MPRSFDISTGSSATVAQVHAAFADERYWQARLAEYGGDSIRLESLIVGDGSVFVGTVQDMRSDGLPSLIAKVAPSDLTVLREETWRVADNDDLLGDVVITTRGAPISGSATASVTSAASGSVLRFAGTVRVKVPLVGGQIEKYISSQIAEEIPGMQRFTTAWIAENGSENG